MNITFKYNFSKQIVLRNMEYEIECFLNKRGMNQGCYTWLLATLTFQLLGYKVKDKLSTKFIYSTFVYLYN